MMNENTYVFDSRLDNGFLNVLYQGNKKHAAVIFEQFLKGIHYQMKEVDDNFTMGNTEQFKRKVHMLKPVLSFVGLTFLTGKADMLERNCAQNSGYGELAELYKDFRNNIVEFIPVIESELIKLKE
jgi:HPt (histidine-containing phosphotransfer) domain-containing protein